MPSDRDYNPEDASLWRGYARAGGLAEGPGACPDAMTLAGYLEGRLSPDQRAAVERHLARCPRCVAEVPQLRALLAEPAMIPPADVADRARRLVAPARERQGQAAPRLWPAVLRWSAAAVLAIAASLLGLQAGRGTARDRQNLTGAPRGQEVGTSLAGIMTEPEPSGDALAMLMGGEPQ
jgi:anti-sigma factor RsiW